MYYRKLVVRACVYNVMQNGYTSDPSHLVSPLASLDTVPFITFNPVIATGLNNQRSRCSVVITPISPSIAGTVSNAVS